MANIPGLNIDSILPKFIEIKYGQDMVDLSDKEKKELTDTLTKYHKDQLSLCINSLGGTYTAITDVLNNISASVTATITATSTPTTIVTGQAVGVPNPAFQTAIKTAFKMSLSSMLSVAKYLIDKFESEANDIGFDAQSIVTALNSQFELTKNLVNTL